MREKVKETLTDFISAIQAAKIYTTKHLKFSEFVDKAYSSLLEILKDRPELIIGIIQGELAFEHDIFFDMSQKLRPLIDYLQEREIERISFLQSLQRDELVKFLTYLTTPREKAKQDAEEYFHSEGIKNIAVGKIKAPAPELKNKVKKIRSYIRQYENSLEKVRDHLDVIIDQKDLDHLELRFDIFNFLENLAGIYREFLDLTTFRRKDLITFVHLLNTTILSLFISSKLGYSKNDVIDIGIASLFHDIGKLFISRKIIMKEGKLDEKEFEIIKHHTVLGTELLFKYIDTLGILPVIVSFEHHLRYDLRGYPKVSFSQKLHPVSLIVSVCDVYDALSLRRSYKRNFPPLKIYEIMAGEKGKLFDPDLLDKFFRVMGVYPVKSIVALSDKRIAVVRKQNETDIFRPKVEILSPKKKRGFVDLLKENISIAEYLNPFDKGKRYLKLIQ